MIAQRVSAGFRPTHGHLAPEGATETFRPRAPSPACVHIARQTEERKSDKPRSPEAAKYVCAQLDSFWKRHFDHPSRAQLIHLLPWPPLAHLLISTIYRHWPTRQWRHDSLRRSLWDDFDDEEGYGWFACGGRSGDRNPILAQRGFPGCRDMQLHFRFVARFDEDRVRSHVDAVRFDVQLDVSLKIRSPAQHDDDRMSAPCLRVLSAGTVMLNCSSNVTTPPVPLTLVVRHPVAVSNVSAANITVRVLSLPGAPTIVVCERIVFIMQLY